MLVKGKLNLNRHPSEVTNGDWTDAVNVIVSEDNVVQNEPAFVNDEDFVNAINNSNIFTDEEDYDIINVIDCNEELVIFCRVDNNDVRLLRYKENTKTIENTGVIIDYHNGKFTNDFQYINNKLVITFSEYDGDEDTVLKVIDFDNNVNNNICKYQNPKIKIPNITNTFRNGNLLKGWYFIYIRYKIKHNNYTRWYNTNYSQLVDSCSEEIIFDYPYGDDERRSSNKLSMFKSTESNTSNIALLLSINDIDINYTDYQLGIIIINKTDTKYYRTEDIVINNTTYLLDTTSTLIVSDNQLINTYSSYYNVKNLNFYKNKTYIANYKEKYILDNIKDIDIELDFKLSNFDVNEDINDNDKVNKEIVGIDLLITDEKGKNYGPVRLIDDTTYRIGDFYCYINKVSESVIPAIYLMNGEYQTDSGNGYMFYSDADGSQQEDGAIRYYPSSRSYYFETSEKEYRDIYIATTVGLPQRVLNGVLSNNLYLIYEDDTEIVKNVNVNPLITAGIMPFNYYNFYIHFVDEFGDVTDGISIMDCNLITKDIYIDNDKKLIYATYYNEKYRNPANKENVNKKLLMTIKLNKLPDNYKAFFISYEQFKNAERQSGFIGTHNHNVFNIDLDYKDKIDINADTINLYNIEKDIISNKDILSLIKVSHVNIDYNFKLLPADTVNNILQATNLKSDKDLGEYNYIIFRNNSNPYKNKSKVLIPCSNITYGLECICNTNNCFVSRDYYININDMLFNTSYMKFTGMRGFDDIGRLAKINSVFRLKEIPTEFVKFKNRPKIIVFPATGNTADAEQRQFVIGSIFEVKDTIDLFEQIHYPIGECYPTPLQNYIKDNYINEFTKTIRRSKIIQDESNTIDNRFFPIESYINIIENKGNIIKLTPVGNIILVHTEYSLFLFDGSDTLKADKYKVQLNEADIWDVGYKEVMTTEKGTAGIEKPEHAIVGEFGYIFYDKKQQYIFRFDNNNIVHIEDDIKQYLVKLKDYDLNITNDVKHNRLLFNFTKDNVSLAVLSYNYKFNKWVSKHTYSYIKGYNTINNIYLLNKDRKTFSKFSNEKYNTNASIDILFNSQYEAIKFIEYIKYKLYKTTPKAINDNSPVEGHVDYYAGNAVRVFTEFCDTNDIDLSEYSLNDKTNSVERYDEPYFRFGNWHVNNLRNNRVGEGEERNRIYGNWFVVRIKFGDNKKVELESIDCKFSPDIV